MRCTYIYYDTQNAVFRKLVCVVCVFFFISRVAEICGLGFSWWVDQHGSLPSISYAATRPLLGRYDGLFQSLSGLPFLGKCCFPVHRALRWEPEPGIQCHSPTEIPKGYFKANCGLKNKSLAITPAVRKPTKIKSWIQVSSVVAVWEPQ